MGLEADCEAKVGRKTVRGKAQLEPGQLIFRSEDRLVQILLERVRSVQAKGGVLDVRWSEGRIALTLGREAEKWALKIRYPRGLLDKLGVKPDMRVSVLGVDDASFLEQLRSRTNEVSQSRPAKESDLVFVRMDARGDLPRLIKLRGTIKKNGAIWVVWPKGRKEFREDDVRAFGPEAGLVDVKVVAFSDTLSALKMVIPVSQR